MLAMLDPSEWQELQAYFDDEPFGTGADDMRAAKLASVVGPCDAEAFLRTPGERRRESREGHEGPSSEATAAFLTVLKGRQDVIEAAKAKGR